jgi:hypothetical protein
MATVVTEKVMEPKEAKTPPEQPVTAEMISHRMMTYGKEIREYLSHVDANVEGYKFSVEKKGTGVEVDVEFKALIHPKPKAEIPK